MVSYMNICLIICQIALKLVRKGATSIVYTDGSSKKNGILTEGKPTEEPKEITYCKIDPVIDETPTLTQVSAEVPSEPAEPSVNSQVFISQNFHAWVGQ